VELRYEVKREPLAYAFIQTAIGTASTDMVVPYTLSRWLDVA